MGWGGLARCGHAFDTPSFYLRIYNKLVFWARGSRLIQSTPIRPNKYVKMFRDNGSVPISQRIFESQFVGIVRAIFEMEWNANIVPVAPPRFANAMRYAIVK